MQLQCCNQIKRSIPHEMPFFPFILGSVNCHPAPAIKHEAVFRKKSCTSEHQGQKFPAANASTQDGRCFKPSSHQFCEQNPIFHVFHELPSLISPLCQAGRGRGALQRGRAVLWAQGSHSPKSSSNPNLTPQARGSRLCCSCPRTFSSLPLPHCQSLKCFIF